MAPATLAYVVLHHTGVAVPHFDLMIESAPDGPLKTWRCLRWPALPEDEITPLPDHRRAYLDYEGPVSRDRGTVRRIESGYAEMTADGELHLLVVSPPGTQPRHLRLPAR